jgi:Tol biopolymer transport system component
MKRILVIVALLVVLFFIIKGAHRQDPNLFGIYTSTLDGQEMKLLLADPYREINHARVSPDKKWINFTRFNRRGKGGLAREPHNYPKTEIMLMRLDGSAVHSLVPPRRGIVAANGYWTPDGQAILYVSNDNPKRKAQINRIVVSTGKITKISTAQDLGMADPHQLGDYLVVSAYQPNQSQHDIWYLRQDGAQARQLTHPSYPENLRKRRQSTPLGDFDPKLSPDGTRVACFRHVGQTNWHLIIVDLQTGRERDISAPEAVDAMPEWSSDGKLLIFWHVDIKDIKQSGLYTVRPDGTGRRRISLPHGYFYKMPAFFPGEGSDKTTRIIFSAMKNPYF